jgi:hypothetical protein
MCWEKSITILRFLVTCCVERNIFRNNYACILYMFLLMLVQIFHPFLILAVLKMFYWDMAPCRLVSSCQHFRAENGDSMFLWNIGIYQRVCMVPKPRRIVSSSSLLWKPQISHSGPLSGGNTKHFSTFPKLNFPQHTWIINELFYLWSCPHWSSIFL